MKSKLKTLFLGVFSIPSLVIWIGIFFDLNGELEEFAFMWFLTQILIAPAYFTIINLLKIKE